MINGWTGTTLMIQRNNETVTVVTVDLVVPAVWNPKITPATPQGFVGSGFTSHVLDSSLSQPWPALPTNYFTHASNVLLQVGGPAIPQGTLIQGRLNYPTEDSWPTTLPGTP